MNSSVRKVVLGATVFVTTLCVAIGAYWSAGWTLIESIYMVVITIFGVGYGEVRPITEPSLRIFTMLFIIIGCSSAAYIMGGLVQMIAEGEINKALGARRMSEGLKRLTGHVIICGYGRVGQILAAELKRSGKPVVVVDTNRDRLLEAELEGFLVVIGDATEDGVLRSAGVDRASILTCVLPNDAINVFITLTAREINNTIEIIARAENPSTKPKLLRSGANRVVLPAAVGAHKIAQLINRPSAEDLLAGDDFENRLNDELHQLGLGLHEVKITADSDLVKQPIGSVEVASDRGVVVVALRKGDGTVLNDPAATTILEADDIVILLGRQHSIPKLARSQVKHERIYRGVRMN
ncbi:potassium channel family protein [Planctomicrobium piriforme]|uniref:Voltage-gated potassium channel n=1 Tax=Planctomicrobium piriforme TaxID=1576369 RepID=A0A1I3F6I9_9PLAN|nr:potassium channel protein [Planctomicrobium piriforme]SFI06836.1 voltage-gated potassium channel [Planctomicrobium piriforme]